MDIYQAYFFTFAATFFVGSIPFGFLIGKLNGIDVREHGSKNIGMTNIWRLLGKYWGIGTFILDFLKGFFPLFFVKKIALTQGIEIDYLMSCAAIAALLGHNYTPWLNFRGGKGIATSAGIFSIMMPYSLGFCLVAWATFFALTRMVSVASLVACIVLPLSTLYFYPQRSILISLAFLAGVLGVFRHRANIVRIFRGEELSFKRKKTSTETKNKTKQ